MREVSNAYGLNEPVSLLLTTTAVTDVVSIAAGTVSTTLVYGVIIVNDDATARLVNLYWTLNATDYGIFSHTVGAGETMTVGFDVPLKLFAKSTARKIRAKAAAASVVTVTVLSALSGQTQDAAN